jgi:2-(3-amino-3-carboxypropyl)histidine synthase
VVVPQSKPLSLGEILGCMAPRMPADHIIIYLSDSRYSTWRRPWSPIRCCQAYKYDPYVPVHQEMRANRKKAIYQSRPAKKFVLILGTLGHQGSIKVMEYLEKRIKYHKRDAVTILLSEIFPPKLGAVQRRGPFRPDRVPSPFHWLGHGVLLTSFTPMDFYVTKSLGAWTPNYKPDEQACENALFNGCCGKCDKKEKGESAGQGQFEIEVDPILWIAFYHTERKTVTKWQGFVRDLVEGRDTGKNWCREFQIWNF